jgi:PhnB protein
MKSANPYLNFPGNTEQAFTHYSTVFGSELIDVLRFSDFGDNEMGIPEHELHKIAHVALPIGSNNLLMGTDTLESSPPLTNGNNFYVAVETETAEEAERVYTGLSEGGQPVMPLQPTVWAEKYGTCLDRFGVQWMVMYTGNAQFG